MVQSIAVRSQSVNYRPISNLSTISKLIKRLVLCRLSPHLLSLDNFNLLQSAYRTGHSTETALLCVLDNIYKSIDSLQLTIVVCLDISAAFDTITTAHCCRDCTKSLVLPACLQIGFVLTSATAVTTSSLVVTVHLQLTVPPASHKGQSQGQSCLLHTYHHSAGSFPVVERECRS